MSAALFPALLLGGVVLVVLFLAHGSARGAFERDNFPTPLRRQLAIGLLFLLLLAFVVIPFASGISGGAPEEKKISPASAFATPVIVVLFLTVYYLLSGRPPLLDFLKLRTRHPLRLFWTGFPIFAFAWAASIAGTLTVELLVNAVAPSRGAKPQVSPLIHAIVAMPTGLKIAVVVTAMIFEEVFFRSFLQPRVGAVGATLFFTLAHGVYGEPLMLVGILVLAAVLALAFELYQNAIPGIVAHGAFDAFQLFVLIPVALKFLPA